jgi:hypothetical protein
MDRNTATAPWMVAGGITRGRCREWIKIKNIAHPGSERAMLIALGKRRGRG